MKRVAIIGTQGVPARYGGFETMVENIIGENCSPDIQYTLFCSSKDLDSRFRHYKGAHLKYLPISANGMQSTIYDALSLVKAIRGYDVVVVLGVSGGLFFPFFRLFNRKRLIVNIDGLEHKRAKWGRFAKLFLRVSERMALRCADVVIADNQGIVDYIDSRYKEKTVLIAYGGDHVRRELSDDAQREILTGLRLESQNYSLAICRIEPENNCHVVLEAFARTGDHLVFVGNWERSEYGRTLKTKYGSSGNVTILESVYDLDILYALRNHCRFYVHGHSAGGTNPSLVEALFFGCPVLAYDVVYNRETTENKAHYFRDVDDLELLLTKESDLFVENATSMVEIAQRRYTWRTISGQYERLYGISSR